MTVTVAIIQARIGSTRLPGKVLFELAGLPAIAVMVRRMARAKGVDKLVIATGTDSRNDALGLIAEELGVTLFRGDEEDVLGRFAKAAAKFEAETVVRLTGDCPLIDPEIVDRVIDLRAANNLDYCTNVIPPTWPDGLDVSVFTRETLDAAAAEATLPSEREHVVPWMWRHSSLEGGSRLRAANLTAEENLSALRWTLDEPADYALLRRLAAVLGQKRLIDSGYRDILEVLRTRPSHAQIGQATSRDAGLASSRRAEGSGA